MALVQLVGRAKAMVLKIEKPIFNRALKSNLVLAEHYTVGPILNAL